MAGFNPNQKRTPDGRFASGSGSASYTKDTDGNITGLSSKPYTKRDMLAMGSPPFNPPPKDKQPPKQGQQWVG